MPSTGDAAGLRRRACLGATPGRRTPAGVVGCRETVSSRVYSQVALRVTLRPMRPSPESRASGLGRRRTHALTRPLSASIFKAYDIRGIVDGDAATVTLTDAAVRGIGAALGLRAH
jgi:hypothetical protein